MLEISSKWLESIHYFSKLKAFIHQRCKKVLPVSVVTILRVSEPRLTETLHLQIASHSGRHTHPLSIHSLNLS